MSITPHLRNLRRETDKREYRRLTIFGLAHFGVHPASIQRLKICLSSLQFSLSAFREIMSPDELSDSTPILLCRICGKPVPVSSAVTDAGGKAVHDGCLCIEVVNSRASRGGLDKSG